MKQCDVVEDLVSVVPSEQGSLSGVVVHHADVGVLIVEGNVSVLICRGVSVIGKVDLGPSQVGVGNVQGAADHEGLPCTALRKPCVPALEDFQSARVQTTYLEKERRGDCLWQITKLFTRAQIKGRCVIQHVVLCILQHTDINEVHKCSL